MPKRLWPPGGVLPNQSVEVAMVDFVEVLVFDPTPKLRHEGKRVMSEDSLDTAEDTGEGEGKGAASKAARIMARALWLVDWSAAHPNATPEERKAAWKSGVEGRSGRVKQARKALKIMGKRGVTFIVAPGAGNDEDDGD